MVPTAMLDAGDSEWTELADKVTERMGDLPSCGILEITFANPDVRVPLLEWCRRSGHDLFQMTADKDAASGQQTLVIEGGPDRFPPPPAGHCTGPGWNGGWLFVTGQAITGRNGAA